ncbi:6-bladed beta-propeller [Aquimarina algiphila]|uniref:6-bladed beta-propeller n=1 Tax=Aquimarina algiphila TaxID=2047982 RepID=A0A554VI39_9FLAO|nr:6-bladed beta-propeller [Aquimarina algiphila]TSE07307.1 6-bladed beta-propeller [Aquimarina algiphila]
MNRRKFLHKSVCASAGILTLPMYSGAYTFDDHKDLIIGHNSHRYKVDLNWGNLNAEKVPVKDCHEIIQDSKGRIVMLTNHIKNNIIVYDKSGKLLETWGTTYPGGHGLTLSVENGEDFLFITDYERHQIIKTTIDGKEVMTIDYPADTGKYKSKEEFKPTETTVLKNGEFYVADGYGNQFILHYNHKGELLNIFGGKGTENDQFLNAHGICLDQRDEANPILLITAREQNKLKRFSLDGNYLSSIEVPGALICRPVIYGNEIYFAVLKSRSASHNGSGFLLIMDDKNEVISCPGATQPIYQNNSLKELYQTIKLFQHPHDVCIDEEGNMYVAQWNSGQTYPIKLTRV